MFPTSTQKRNWMFSSQDEVDKKRVDANARFKEKWAPQIEDEEEERIFFSKDEEQRLTHVVAETGLKFGDAFRPPLFPTVRYTAFAYYRRFFLSRSAMEYSPKNVMTCCYYLACKIDEFYVSIDEFVSNMRSGTPEQNMNRLVSLEPELMKALNYELCVHAPFRPFEGLLLEMKTRLPLLNFDLETVRPIAMHLFKRSLVTDAMFLYPPSQLALAGLKYGLDELGKSPELLLEFLCKQSGIDDGGWPNNQEKMAPIKKLIARGAEIVAYVLDYSKEPSDEESRMLMSRMIDLTKLLEVLEERRLSNGGAKKVEEPVDSDDD